MNNYFKMLPLGFCYYVCHDSMLRSPRHRVGISNNINETLEKFRRLSDKLVLDYLLFISEDQCQVLHHLIKAKFIEHYIYPGFIRYRRLEDILEGIDGICLATNIDNKPHDLLNYNNQDKIKAYITIKSRNHIFRIDTDNLSEFFQSQELKDICKLLKKE